MKLYKNIGLVATLVLVVFFATAHVLASATDTLNHVSAQHPKVKKVLFIGDSMTGWLAERFNAYGQQDGFEVATVVWDGSTIAKWGATPKLKQIIEKEKPDAIFVSLGMNELFERNPEARLGKSVDNILSAFGDIPYVWIGPPTWPGKNGGETMNRWLEEKTGSDRYFNSTSLTLPRQARTNPHPTREGIVKWMDSVVEWLPGHQTWMHFENLSKPAAGKMSRGKTYIYKKMKETL